MDIFVSSFVQALNSRTAILQTLNRMVGDVLFSMKPFEKSVDKWNGVPIVYSKYHPDMTALSENPKKELARIGGKVVGAVKNARIELPGHPRLMADMDIHDGGVNKLIDEGKISLSTGFWAADNGAELTGAVIPNHVLVFPETLFSNPRDLGSGFLNGPTHTDSDNQTIITEVTRGLTNMPEQTEGGQPGQSMAPAMSAQEVAQLENVDVEKYLNMQTTYENKLKQAQAVQEEQYNKIKAQEAKLAKFLQMEKDTRWENLKGKLPRGLVEGAEAEKTRARLNQDPEGLMSHVIDIMNQDHQAKMVEQGKQYLNSTTAKIKEESSGLCSGIEIVGEY